MSPLEQIDELVRAERYERAVELIREQLARDDLDPVLRWRLRLRWAERGLASLEQPVDEAIFQAQELLEAQDDAEPAELPRVHAAVIRGFAAKRCPELVREAVAAARDAVGEAVEVLLAEGTCALELDNRDGAREVFQTALERYPKSSAARLAMANLCYVLGDFAGCHARLEGIEPGQRGWGSAQRIRAAAFAAAHDYEAEAARWAELVERLPDGDHLQDDRIALALTLATEGQSEAALAHFRAVWRAAPDTRGGRYARERIESLERAPDDAKRRHVAAFPTTQQKWNYCGPAVLELCLRHLDIDLGQDEIARQVKRTTGTPMYEMVQYLRERGVEARRIEATPDRLRRAIDLGLPVIVQEEYSTTSHVAVITGYDEALGLFIANDPITHRQVLRSFGWTERAGAMYGNGGLIVLGRAGAELEPLRSRADEAGLIEARHLVLLDECDRRRARPASGELEDAALEQVIQLGEEALSLSPRFKLAHYRLWHTENQLYHLSGRPHLRERVLDRLHTIRTSFPDDEWPHQLHGQWLMDDGRYEEAFVAYFEASRRDPQDANNLQAMGECKWLAGDLVQAERYMLEAVAAEPCHLRAAENLAGVYLRHLQELDAVTDGDQQAADPIVELTAMVPHRLASGGLRSELSPEEDTRLPARRSFAPEEAARRAWHFNRVARSVAPENPFNHEVAGALCHLQERHVEAVESYRRAREINDGRVGALYGLARSHSALEQVDEAEKLLDEGCQRFWREPLTWAALAEFLRQHDRPAEAVELLERGLATLPRGHSRLVRPYFSAVRRLESAEAAAARLRQLAEQRPGDDELLRDVAYLLDERGQRGHAVALLRHVVAASPSDVNALFRLANLLGEDLVSRAEGRRLMERVVELAPDAAAPRRQLAWLLLEEAPEQALSLLDPVLDQEDPYVYETRAALLAAVGRTEESEVTFQLALEAHGSFGPALIDLCAWHIRAKRYQRALAVARQIFDHPLPSELEEDARYFWLQAHRLAGAVREIMPRLKELCDGGVPADLSWDIYWASRSFDHGVAAEAAETFAGRLEDERERKEWRILAAGQRAKLGDEAPLRERRAEAGDDPQLWAQLSWAYADLKRFDEANAAAKRAYELDPKERHALTVMEETHVRLCQPEQALSCARQLCDLYPYEHQGPERLGILLAKLLNPEEALRFSLQAVDAAPFCHISHRSRALALFVAGRLEEAERHAVQSLALDEPDEEDAANDALMVLRALRGDVGGLERCLRNLEREEPPEVFDRFKAHLLEVARQRAPSDMPN
jgi:tetratricopeptide (TPR) repeat protein